EEIVQEVNKLSIEEQTGILREKWPGEILPKAPTRKIEEKALPPLPNVEKYNLVVTRFAPNPNAPLHIGQARAIILSHEYARLYKGKFILRLEDTDPRLKRSSLQFIDMIRKDLEWLGCIWDEEYIQSDRIPIYYEYAEKLLKEEKAYICTCKPQDFRERILVRRACPCRNLSSEENLKRWDMMLDGTYGEGEAVLRIKTELSHPNPAVRDWPALRIIDTKKYPHPRVGSKYRVWPLYNFACGIDDHLMGVTHIIRGKEHLTNQVRQMYLYHHLGWQYPEAVHYGRLKIVGAPLSKSKIVQDVKKGIYNGWDDPRLATFAALRKRGITPEAIRLLMLEVGLRASDITLSWENLYAHNRKIIDPIAKRYFFVSEPVHFVIYNLKEDVSANLPYHPDRPELGFRKLHIKVIDGKAELYISKSDMEILREGKVVRLIGLLNVTIKSVKDGEIEAVFHSRGHQEAKRLKAPLIHWVPKAECYPCNVVMPDNTRISGIVEKNFIKVTEGEIVQLERFGFGRVERNEPPFTVYYAHR
ncbi:MAG TPA: glutamate--tRNA ligase, partial [Candidatus Bathyarchaeota archaeon]|nr:glutamate--tRNA ligase [Candidatus Bathyarchaeota archaeon]